MIDTHDLEPVEIYESQWKRYIPAPSHVCKKCGMYFIYIQNAKLHNIGHLSPSHKDEVYCYWSKNNWYCCLDYICSINIYYAAIPISYDEEPELTVCGAKNMHEALQ